MHFRAEHHFSTTVEELLEAMVDPVFHLGLELPDLNTPAVVERNDDGIEALLSLRYTFVGHLDPFARRLLGDEPEWVQEIRIDRGAAGGSLHFAAARQQHLLGARADFVVRPRGEGVERDLEGEVDVRLPFVAAAAERSIVAGLLTRLDLEASALERSFAAPSGG